MCLGQVIATKPVMARQKPSSQSFLDAVAAVRKSRVRELDQARMDVPKKQAANGRPFIHRFLVSSPARMRSALPFTCMNVSLGVRLSPRTTAFPTSPSGPTCATSIFSRFLIDRDLRRQPGLNEVHVLDRLIGVSQVRGGHPGLRPEVSAQAVRSPAATLLRASDF